MPDGVSGRVVSLVGDWLRSLSPRVAGVLVFVVMAGIYLPTAAGDYHQSVDSLMASFAAWSVAERGTLNLADVREHVQLTPATTRQTVEVGDRLYINRFPGVIATGVPFYWADALLGNRVDRPSRAMLPMGGVAGAVVTALAVAVLHLVFRRLVAGDIAIIAAVLFGLATATWSISASALWSHGPAQLWLAAGMLAVATRRYATSGLAWSMALLTRPHLGVVAATVGLFESRVHRSWRPAVKVAATTAIGLAAWLLYGRLVFGQWTILGGFVDRHPLEERLAGGGVGRTLVNLFWMVVQPVRGFLPYSPFLLGLAPGIPRAWRRAPSWVRASALAAVVYLVTQAYINRWSGGSYYWGYRYAIESVTLVAPLLVLAYEQLSTRGRQVTVVLVAVAIALQIPGAVFDLVV